MIRPLNLLFVLADAGHARLVSLSRETGDYRTLLERRSGKPPRKGKPVAVFQRFGHGRSTTGPEAGETARTEAEFIRGLADDAAARLNSDDFAGVVLVAPPRTMSTLKRFLPASIKIVGELAKDLTKVRDHDLAAWLRGAGGAPAP